MAESQKSADESVAEVQSRASVLLVEDDDDFRKTAAKGLTAMGFDVIEAATAEEALEVTTSDEVPVDVVVLDVMLPDSWGPQVGFEQSFLRPEIKFIYMSGYTRHDSMLRASLDARKDVPFLEKPFTIQELADTIQEVIEDGSSSK